jgi:hypothetical protein
MKLMLVVAGLLALAACDYRTADTNRCADYGFEEGTEGMAACKMQVGENRRAMGAVLIAGDP